MPDGARCSRSLHGLDHVGEPARPLRPDRLDQDLVEVLGERLGIEAERERGVRLRIQVDEQHAISGGREAAREIDGGGGLPAAALLVHDRDGAHGLASRAGTRARRVRECGGAGRGARSARKESRAEPQADTPRRTVEPLCPPGQRRAPLVVRAGQYPRQARDRQRKTVGPKASCSDFCDFPTAFAGGRCASLARTPSVSLARWPPRHPGAVPSVAGNPGRGRLRPASVHARHHGPLADGPRRELRRRLPRREPHPRQDPRPRRWCGARSWRT